MAAPPSLRRPDRSAGKPPPTPRPSIWSRAWKDWRGGSLKKAPEKIAAPLIGAVIGVIFGVSRSDVAVLAALAGLAGAVGLGLLAFLWRLILTPRQIIEDLCMQLDGHCSAVDSEEQQRLDATKRFKGRYTRLVKEIADLESLARRVEGGATDAEMFKVQAWWVEFLEVRSTLDAVNHLAASIATGIEKGISPRDLRLKAEELRDACVEANRILRWIYEMRVGKASA